VVKLLRTDRTRSLDLRRGWRWMVALLATGAASLALAAPAAQAGTANGGLPGAGSNPIANIAWGAPHNDDLWNAYRSVSGSNRQLLARLALKPRAVWLGYWDPTGQVRADTAATVAASQNGNPNALTEFATFELNPWERWVVHGSWNVSADETWYRNMAAGIGSAPALVIVQADLPFAHRTSSTAPEQIDTYAAQVLSADPHTTVYIDGGTEGWYNAEQDASLLIRNGIRYARGFALNDTDYNPTALDDEFGARVVADLAKLGVKGKHFIVDTDENGQSYGYGELRQGTRINDATICHGRIQTVCQRTGIPPTTNVASPRWDLGAAASAAAKRYCDGYVWSGRPWNIDAGPFVRQYALWLAANGEY
jgi:endoglucanase